MIRFEDPRAPSAVPVSEYRLGHAMADDVRVAFLANGFPDSVPFLEALADALRERLPTLRAGHWNKGNASIPAPEAMLDEIERDADVLVAAWGH